MKCCKYLLLLGAMLCATPFVQAQQLETIYESLYRPMSYEECVARSVFFDSNVGRQLIDSAMVRLNLDKARSAYLPTLRASFGENWELGRAQDNTGTYLERSSANSSLAITTSYDLFTGLRRPSMLKTARLREAQSDAALAGLRERAELRVAGFFYNLLLQEEIIRVARLRIEQTERTLAQTRTFVEGGKWPASKISEVEAQLEADRASLIEAENGAAIIRVDLSVAVEYYGEAPLQIITPDIDQLIQEARAKIIPPATIYQEALARRPEIKATDFGIAAAEERIRTARTGYWPQLSLNAGYSNAYFRLLGRNYASSNQSLAEQLKHNGRFFVGVTLSVPIFDAFATSQAIRQAKIDLKSAQTDKIDADLGLYKEIFKAHANAVAAERTIVASGNAERAARSSAEAVRASFEAGRSTTFELEQAENKLLMAQIDALRAKYDFILKSIFLELYRR